MTWQWISARPDLAQPREFVWIHCGDAALSAAHAVPPRAPRDLLHLGWFQIPDILAVKLLQLLENDALNAEVEPRPVGPSNGACNVS